MQAGPPAADVGAARDPVVARYVAGLRPARRRYAVVIAAVLAAVAVGVTLAWLTGEEHATTLHTATAPEPAVANEPLGPSLSVAWTSDEATAGGTTVTQGTIVTYAQHSVNGRSALTGDLRWSYTRTDVAVCGVVTQDGIAVAVFDKHGSCNQAVGLDAVTGERRWNRTLLDTGQSSTMTSRADSVMIRTARSVHVISPDYDPDSVPSGGLDRWYWRPAGCAVDAASLGGRGILTSLDCGGTARLVLRKPYDDGDQWSIDEGTQALLVTDGAALGWDRAASQLVSFALDTGTRAAAAELPGCTDPAASEVGGIAMVLCSGTLHAFAASGAQLREIWSTPAMTLPAIQSTTEAGAGQIVVLGTDGARTVGLQSGTPASAQPVALPSQAIAAIQSASRVERNGSGLLIAGSSTTVLRGAG